MGIYLDPHALVCRSCLPPCAAISVFCSLVLPRRRQFRPALSFSRRWLYPGAFIPRTHTQDTDVCSVQIDTTLSPFSFAFLRTPLTSSLLGPSSSPQWPPSGAFAFFCLSHFFCGLCSFFFFLTIVLIPPFLLFLVPASDLALVYPPPSTADRPTTVTHECMFAYSMEQVLTDSSGIKMVLQTRVRTEQHHFCSPSPEH